jgi:hypothetical protein
MHRGTSGNSIAYPVPSSSVIGTKASIQPIVRGSVDAGTQVHSDEHGNTWKMDDEYTHNIINHLEAYVVGNVHTNGIENFWSLLKRTLGGTYVSVEPFHLFRYVDEQAFRFNNRGPMEDADRFRYAMQKIVGKRLTYAELTDKDGAGAESRRTVLSGFPVALSASLRLGAALVRVQCSLLAFRLNPALQLGVGHREHLLHCALEARERFRAFHVFCFALHESIMPRD